MRRSNLDRRSDFGSSDDGWGNMSALAEPQWALGNFRLEFLPVAIFVVERGLKVRRQRRDTVGVDI